MAGLDRPGNHVRDHSNEGHLIVGTTSAVELDAGLCCCFVRFEIEVVKNFDMVGNKADGSDDDLGNALHREIAYDAVDIGLEPGIARFTAAALIGDGPIIMAD